MKTKTTLTSIKSNIAQARSLEDQARQLRRKCRDIREQVQQEEEAILQSMVELVQQEGVFMTAAEISRAMGGVVSVHEVAGQLTWARNSTDSGRKPQPYFGPMRYSMRHEAMQEAAPRVEVEERRVTRHFAEVDETGAVIPGGRVFNQVETRNIYSISK